VPILSFSNITLLKLSSGLQGFKNALYEDIYVVREIGSIRVFQIIEWVNIF
jgi:hypothetical protein